MRTRVALSVLCIYLVTAPAEAQTTWHVDNGNCPGPGSGSEGDPFCKIQVGIDASSTGDTVIVADGTYTGNGNRDLDFGGRDIHLLSESLDPELCIIDCQGSEANPHRGFYFHSGETNAAVLQGFTVRNGHAATGGAIRCDSGSVTIIGCIMTDNAAMGHGGGFTSRKANPLLLDCIIQRNTSGPNGGGGVSATSGTLTLIGCEISENCALRSQNNGGGGMLVTNAGTILEMVGCTVRDNDAGGGRGGGLLWQSVGTVSETLFLGNQAGIGAGAFVNNSGTLVVGCEFENNAAETFGGGLYGRRAEVVNCVFSGNSATLGGGAIYAYCQGATCANCVITGNTTSGEGGGVLSHGTMSLVGCTIYGNTAARGGGVEAQGNCGTELDVVNTIVWNNAAAMGPELAVVNGEFGKAATLNVSYTDAQGGAADVFVDTNGTLNWGLGNIDVDPLYVDAGIEDYHVSVDSLVIDAGDNEAVPPDSADLDDDGDTDEPTPFDLDGYARIVDGDGDEEVDVDMGAYEFQTDGPCPWDLNGDGIVGPFDLALVLGFWGPNPGHPSDLNGDGEVGPFDLALLLGNWGLCP